MRPSLRSGFKHSSNGAQEAQGGPNRAQEAPGGPYVKLFVVMYGRNGVDLYSSSSMVAMAAVSTWRRAIETLRASSTFAEFARMLEILRLTLTNRPILAHLIATPLPPPIIPPPRPLQTHTHPHTRLPYTHTHTCTPRTSAQASGCRNGAKVRPLAALLTNPRATCEPTTAPPSTHLAPQPILMKRQTLVPIMVRPDADAVPSRNA